VKPSLLHADIRIGASASFQFLPALIFVFSAFVFTAYLFSVFAFLVGLFGYILIFLHPECNIIVHAGHGKYTEIML